LNIKKDIQDHVANTHSRGERAMIVFLVLLMLFPFDWVTAFEAKGATSGQNPDEQPLQTTGTVPEENMEVLVPIAENDTIRPDDLRESLTAEGDTVMTVVQADDYPYGLDGKRVFNPSPERAVWMSALFPGLGQLYNRRYWKLPIVVGGFMGLGYATSWNNNQYRDYTQAYRDLLDSDPTTKSYMDFFPPNTSEADLDTTWLTSLMKSRRDYYRRYRDLCIICIVALYLVCMVDAYVDASLAHFDISPELSMDVQPAMFIAPTNRKVSLGLQWAINF